MLSVCQVASQTRDSSPQHNLKIPGTSAGYPDVCIYFIKENKKGHSTALTRLRSDWEGNPMSSVLGPYGVLGKFIAVPVMPGRGKLRSNFSLALLLARTQCSRTKRKKSPILSRLLASRVSVKLFWKSKDWAEIVIWEVGDFKLFRAKGTNSWDRLVQPG